MTYTSPTWVDVPNGSAPPAGAPAVNAANLQALTDTVAAADSRLAGLTNVNNTADASKPVSAPQATAIAAAQAAAISTAATAAPGLAPVQSVASRTGAVTLSAADVNLANVNNTSDAAKPISTAQAAVNATLIAPAATGVTATDTATVNAAKLTGAQLQAGTYVVSSLTLNTGDHIAGSSRDKTIIQLANGQNADLIVSNGFSGLTGGNTTGGIYGFAVTNLTLDGNKANNTAGYGLRVYGYGFTISDVIARNCQGDGIYTEWSTSPGAPSPNSMESFYDKVKSHDNTGNGITNAGPHDSQFSKIICYTNGGRGIWVKSAGNGALFSDSHSWGNTGICWYLEGETHLVNCVGEGSGTSAATPQVFIGVNDCSIIGGTYYCSSTGKVGFEIGDSSHTGIAGTQIKTKLLNATTYGVWFNSDGGGNDVDVLAYNCPTLTTGYIDPRTRVRIRTNANHGPQTAPAVPASGTGNFIVTPFSIDATVYVTGGTVTAIYVNGVATGTTSGPVRISGGGGYIALVYTVAPTWVWVCD